MNPSRDGRSNSASIEPTLFASGSHLNGYERPNFLESRIQRGALVFQSLLLAGSAAHAESAESSDEKTTLPGVTVEEKPARPLSSPKFTEPLRDTPQTVVVIPSAVYTEQGATNLRDVLRNTPGITFAAGEGGGAASTSGDAFYMRGFDTSNNIFVDGVRDVGAYSRDVFNLEQVEVAKGPAGADVGRGVSSGYINLVTKVPRLEDFVRGSLTYGVDEDTSGSRRRATVDVNEKVDTTAVKGVALRLNGMWQDSDAVGRAYAQNKSWALAPSLALGLGTDTQVTFQYQHTQQNNRPDYGMPSPAFPGAIFTPAAPAIDRTTFFGFISDYDHVLSDSYTARIQHDFSKTFFVSNQTRYSEVERNAIVSTPGTSPTAYVAATGLLTRSRQGNKRDTSIFSNQTNVTAQVTTGMFKHNLTGGVELTREKAYSPTFTSIVLTPIPLLGADPTALPSGTPFRSGALSDVKTDTGGFYGFDTIKFATKWMVSGGLRLDRYRTNYYALAADNTKTYIDGSGNLATWKAGLVFKPVTEGSLYAAYGVSQKPPGSDFTLSSAINNQNNPDTSPQRTESAEAGVKWDFFKSRLSTTAAAFSTTNDKTVFTDPILGAVPAGKQTVDGLEFSVSGKATDDWLVFGGLAYLHTKYNSGTAAQVGASLPLTPRLSGNFWTTYKLPFGLTLGGGTQYMGEANRLDATTTVPRTMPSYWLFTAVASYTVNTRVALRFNVDNVFDKKYVQSYNNNGGRFTFGSPRAYLLTVNLSY